MNDEYLIYGETLKAIADSIRSVSSVSTTWTPDEMAAYILANLVKPTSRQAAKTYTPSTSNQTIPKGTFLTGAATIQGDADWVEGNIKKGVNMWGKAGTLSGIWGDPSGYGFTAVKSGSVTLSSAQSNYTVTHGLGILPKFVLFCNHTLPSGIVLGSTSQKYPTCMFAYQFGDTAASGPAFNISASLARKSYNSSYYIYDGKSGSPGYEESTSMYSSTNANVSGCIYNVTTNRFSINASQTSWTSYLYQGTYKWLVMG